ncbi:hypothetical protein D7Z54_28650 [Salibacterium salarium]|uniref:Uncharacterized protein n=1 Tax=Salibacterium salarium TaxID=284579 RepID=A0A3R9PG00_9BACI|nr:hypothetical protein [Salibacterium salarium]RSL29910.1 hypothetical protein D7Z54_28650 [Salibacterium salarium]
MNIFLKIIALIIAAFLFSWHMTIIKKYLIFNLYYFIPLFIIVGLPVNLLIERVVKNRWVQYTYYTVVGIILSLLIGYYHYPWDSWSSYAPLIDHQIKLGIIASVLSSLAVIIANKITNRMKSL